MADMIANSFAKDTDVLHAIAWIEAAWQRIAVKTINHYFHICGIGVIAEPTLPDIAAQNGQLYQLAAQLGIANFTVVNPSLPTAEQRRTDDGEDEKILV